MVSKPKGDEQHHPPKRGRGVSGFPHAWYADIRGQAWETRVSVRFRQYPFSPRPFAHLSTRVLTANDVSERLLGPASAAAHLTSIGSHWLVVWLFGLSGSFAGFRS